MTVPLSDLQKSILQYVSLKNEATLTELYTKLKKNRRAVWSSINTLIEKGFVKAEQKEKKVTATRYISLTEKGIAALFAYLNVDPVSYYQSRKQKLPAFVEMIERLFSKNKDLRRQTCKNVYSSILNDHWTIGYDNGVIQKRMQPANLSILLAISEVARFYLKSGEFVDKREYVHLLDLLAEQSTKYASEMKKEFE